MKSIIGITNDLADVFLIQALREGYCNYARRNTQEKRIDFADYLVNKGHYNNDRYNSCFDRLSHILLMYDQIELPIMNDGFILTGEIEKIATISDYLPKWCFSTEQLTTEELSEKDAICIKPIIMSAIKNINFTKPYKQYAIERGGSINGLFSTVYDMMYNHTSGKYSSEIHRDLARGYRILDENRDFNLDCPESFILYTYKTVICLVKEFLIYLLINSQNDCDYYSHVFSNFSTGEYVNEAYGIIKTQISNIIDQQPAFESISEILSFKDKKKNAINSLRQEVLCLEALLKEGATEAAIKKAIDDVRLANNALIKNTPAKRIAQIATYITVPIGFLEYLSFGTPFSLLISIVGAIAQLSADRKAKQSEWLFVAR